MIPIRIIGTLEAFSEQHTEGIVWAVFDNSAAGYASLNILADGDYLFIEDGKKGIEWEGTVKFDYDMNRRPCQFTEHGTWQRVNNCTVHGLQTGIDPKKWFKWFTSNRPAVLIKGLNHDSPIDTGFNQTNGRRAPDEDR
jgi:hypothetical protein